MEQELPPMPTGDRPYTSYHTAYAEGVAGFVALIAGFAIGTTVWGYFVGAQGAKLAGASSAVALWLALKWQKRRLMQNRAEEDAAETRTRWAEKEAETQRKIAAMNEKERNRSK